MTERKDLSINIPLLARVEGEGALSMTLRDGRVSDVQLRIFEPPRYFEKFLEGRGFDEVPDIVARICGICPVAYQMSAVHALESIFQAQPGPWVRAMRRALYCGEWIESHMLHVHLLAAPDFLGFDNAIDMAKRYKSEVARGLALQHLGNDIIQMFGGRSVHPIGVRVGGFYKAPSLADVANLVKKLRAGLAQAEEAVRWTAGLPLPESEQEFVSVALRHADEYAMNEGDIVASNGVAISPSAFEQHFVESHVPYSTALHCTFDGAPYLVGPLARLNINHDRLPQLVRALIADIGLRLPSKNMFHSIIARAVEVYYALIEAVRILEAYREEAQPAATLTIKAGEGAAATEAPRGLLWHRYEVDGAGEIRNARIVPPTSQNQARIEEDLKATIEALGASKSDDELRLLSESVIRNYDPCISCSTHFLTLQVNRESG